MFKMNEILQNLLDAMSRNVAGMNQTGPGQKSVVTMHRNLNQSKDYGVRFCGGKKEIERRKKVL